MLDHNQAGQLDATLKQLDGCRLHARGLDTPGIDSHATRGAMRGADLCLVPVRPSEADVKATMPTISALTAMACPYAPVINQAPTNRQARLTSTVSLRLSNDGPVLPIAIAARIDHQDAYALVQGVQEFAPEGKATAEIAELWAACRNRIDCNGKHEAKRRA